MSRDFPQRKNIRLKHFDYAQCGAYFVTVCTQGRACLFGDVVNGEMMLNEAGKMIENVWNDIPGWYPLFDVGGFVVMPNHLHGIICIVENMDDLILASGRWLAQ